jgi:lysophospholipase L1-like esterase
MTHGIKATRRALFQTLRLAELLGAIGWGVIAMAMAMATANATATAQSGQSADRGDGETWVASWASSMHGPYPFGNMSAQPVLDFAIESAEHGARDQTLRQIIKPDLWGRTVRLHLANTFGTRAVTFDDVFVGVQATAAAVAAGTNTKVTFNQGAAQVTIAPGASVWSDPIVLAFVTRPDDPLLAGRKLAVSLHIVGSTGPMTFHAKAMTTSYLTAPGAGSRGADLADEAFPFTTTSWFLLDALDVRAPKDTAVIACVGDSITDGTASTLNGDDRWPDVLSRRLHAAYGTRVSVVNAGIGGNRILNPATPPATPARGGPSMLARLDRDVLSLSGLSTIVWLEGINDISAGASAEEIIAGMKEFVRRVRAHGDIRIVGATLTSSVGSSTTHGTPAAEARRQAVNALIRTGGLFTSIVDFDAATRDAKTGGLRAPFVPNSTIGGAGDSLHPNRAGYQAMAMAIPMNAIVPFAPAPSPAPAR